MHKNKFTHYSHFFLAGILIFSISCKKDVAGADKDLYDKSVTKDGYVNYKKSDDILSKSAGSGHSDAKLLVRFNSVASAMLDSTGKVKSGVTFPDNSIIVKDLFNKKGDHKGYAVMLKMVGDANADGNGWVWAVYTTDGKVNQSVSKKGSGCTGCHAGGGNIDGTLMNVSFP